MERQQTAEFIEDYLESHQRMHRLNGISELMALADYCTKNSLKTEFISKEEHDTFIDPENKFGAWVLKQEDGLRLKISSKSGEVIFTLRIQDKDWSDYIDHVADWQTFVNNSTVLLKGSPQKSAK